MKILLLGNPIFLKKIMSENNLFHYDFASFIPKNHSYDAIIAEDSMEGMNHEIIPVFLLNNSLNLQEDNIFYIDHLQIENLNNKLMKIYHNIQSKVPQSITPLQKQENLFTEKQNQIYFQVSSLGNWFSFQEKLNNYQIDKKHAHQVFLMITEFLSHSKNKLCNITIEIKNNLLHIFFPGNFNSFFANQYCSGFSYQRNFSCFTLP